LSAAISRLCPHPHGRSTARNSRSRARATSGRSPRTDPTSARSQTAQQTRIPFGFTDAGPAFTRSRIGVPAPPSWLYLLWSQFGDHSRRLGLTRPLRALLRIRRKAPPFATSGDLRQLG